MRTSTSFFLWYTREKYTRLAPMRIIDVHFTPTPCDENIVRVCLWHFSDCIHVRADCMNEKKWNMCEGYAFYSNKVNLPWSRKYFHTARFIGTYMYVLLFHRDHIFVCIYVDIYMWCGWSISYQHGVNRDTHVHNHCKIECKIHFFYCS